MRYVLILASVLTLAAARPASAQIAVSTFEQLQAGVKPGDRLFVIDKTGIETDGRLQSLSPEVLTLALKGQQERHFTRDDVVVIRKLTHDSVWNGAAIWGAGIGALVDACILTPQDIFRTGPARVAVRPAVGRGRVGATVTMRW